MEDNKTNPEYIKEHNFIIEKDIFKYLYYMINNQIEMIEEDEEYYSLFSELLHKTTEDNRIKSILLIQQLVLNSKHLIESFIEDICSFCIKEIKKEYIKSNINLHYLYSITLLFSFFVNYPCKVSQLISQYNSSNEIVKFLNVLSKLEIESHSAVVYELNILEKGIQSIIKISNGNTINYKFYVNFHDKLIGEINRGRIDKDTDSKLLEYINIKNDNKMEID